MNNVRSVPLVVQPLLGRLLVGGRKFLALEKSRVGSSPPPRHPALAAYRRDRRPSGDVRPDPAAVEVCLPGHRLALAGVHRGPHPVSEVCHLGLRPVLTGVRRDRLPGRPALTAPASFFRGRTCVPRPARPCSRDAVAVLVKLGEQLNSLAATASSSSAPAAAPPARWRGRAPFRPGLIAGALPAPERIAGGLAFLLVEFAVLFLSNRSRIRFRSAHGRGVPRHVAAALPAEQTPLGQSAIAKPSVRDNRIVEC